MRLPQGPWRRPATVTAYASMSAIAVLLAVTARVDTVKKADLNDGGIWVTSGADHAFGRFVKAIGQLDAAVFPRSTTSTDLDVLQDGGSVLAWDRSASTLFPVDTAMRQLAGDGVALPPGAQIAMGGGTLAALDDAGDLRVGHVGSGTPDPSSVGAQAIPTRKNLGKQGQLAVANDGTVAVATPSSLVVVPLQGAPRTVHLTATQAGRQVTFVGSTVVALDEASGRLDVIDGTSVRHRETGLGAGARLQQSGSGTAAVAVAGHSGLVLVPLDGGEPKRVSSAGNGSPAAPVRLGSCVYAAWQDGSYARSCGGAPAPSAQGFAATPSVPVFRVNRGLVLLNDAASGAVFVVDDTARHAQDIWKRVQQTPNAPVERTKDAPRQHRGDNKPPEPHDDEFGARVGRPTVLHVLDNDTDPEGDILTVTKVLNVTDGLTAVVSPDAQSVVVTLADGIRGNGFFDYEVSDGYGGQARAHVTVVPRGSGDNKAPYLHEQVQDVAVAPGGTVRLPILERWRDYDGDPLTITDVKATPSGQAVATADGSILVTAPLEPGILIVRYSVSDGIAPPVTEAIKVTVLDRNGAHQFQAPAARPDAVHVVVGRSAPLRPLQNDLPGADATDPQAHLTIAAPVAATDGLDVATDQAHGLLTLNAKRAGTFHLSYLAGYGAAPTSQGEIRVDAVNPDGRVRPPVTTPTTAVLHGQKPTTVDVLARDVDPQGGVLVVQDVTGDDTSGISASVVDGRQIRLVATHASDGVTKGLVRYRVSNGLTPPVDGTVAVALLPKTPGGSTPFAPTAQAVVRAGDSTAVSVLDNAFDPDGDDISLVPLPIDSPDGAVHASVSGRTVRIAADASITTPRQLTLQYVISNPDGVRSTGLIAVNVQPVGKAEEDQPPVPRDLEARLVSGDTYTVHVPIYGVDPDGDSVSVSAVTRPPSMGRILAVGPDTITYQAYPTSGGTDAFTYQVADPQGRTGQAQVRLGIVAPGALAPAVAVDNVIVGIPGRTVHVDVAANAIVPAGTQATVWPLSRLGSVPPGVNQDGNVISVRVPDPKSPLTIPFAVSDGSGQPSQANLVVRGDPTAFIPPIAQDDYPPLDVNLSGSVTVDVLRNDDDPDGSVGSLKVTPLASDVRMDGQKLVIPVSDQPRQVAYLDTDTDGLTAMAVVHVPGRTSGLPRLKPGARITVGVGQSVKTPLSDIVEVPAGGAARLMTTDTLFSSPQGGVALSAADEHTLEVTASGQYRGPGAVSFQVSDKPTLQDSSAHVVELTVPVQVGPVAPALRCPSAPLTVVQGGQDAVADLISLCHVWVDSTVKTGPLRIDAALARQFDGVSVRVDAGTRLHLSASGSAKPGSGSIHLTVPGTPAGADLSMSVIAAPKATVRAVPLNGLLADRATTVDLAGYIASPLRDPRLTLLDAHQTAGTPVAVVRHGTAVTVTPGHDTHGQVAIAVSVTDEPGQTGRAVALGLSGVVAGRPDAPGQPSVTDIRSHQLTIAFAAPADNGSPIQRYEIGGGPGAVRCNASPCTIRGLTNGTNYSFTVRAVNAVDRSNPSAPSPSAAPDQVPGVVTSVRLIPADGSVAATWLAAPTDGSPVDDYQAQISGGGLVATHGATSHAFTGLSNGSSYQVRVRAHNRSKLGWGAWSASVAQVPFGKPLTMPAPQASGADVPNPSKERAVTVSWAAAHGNGRDVTTYTISQYTDSSAAGAFATKVSEVKVSGSVRSRSYTVANDGKFYKFSVSATNSGDASTNAPSLTSDPSPMSAAVQGAAPPDRMTAPVASDHPAGSSAGYDGAIHVRYTTPPSNAQTLTSVHYRLSSGATGSWPATASGQPVEQSIAVDNGTAVTVEVWATNDAGMAGPASSPSNPATPYGPPNAPGMSASMSGQSVTYSWSGGGANGRAITAYHVCIDGTCSDHSTPGSTTRNYGTGVGWSAYASATDAAGQTSGRSNTVSGTTPLNMQLTVSEGAANTTSYCTVSYCHYIYVTASGYAPNTTYTLYFDTDCNTTPTATRDACLGPGGNETTHYNSQTVVTDGNGHFEGNTRSFGYHGASVWVDMNGKESNHVTWN